ncbi:MAG: amidohydrolase family protein, partial [Gammaproteobacteria bacterium]|nr:amidohydrolase family protein [Gammaproteobacteria bacterium]
MTIVVDCDSHVMEPPDLWQNYLEAKYQSRAIRIEENDGVEQLIIGEQVVLQGVLAGLGGANLNPATLFTQGAKYMEGCPPASYDPNARAAMLDEWGVDRGVLFPTIGILPFPTDDVDLASAYCRAYNRWQADFFQTVPDRVVPIAALNWLDVDEAVRELQTCIDAGFHGLFVPPEVCGEHRPGEAHFDPIWQLCDEANIPGCFHVIVRFGGAAVAFGDWSKGGRSLGGVFTFGLGATGQLIPAMASVVLDGLFDRFPTLKIASVEAGCGYAAYLMDRLDEKHHFFGFASGLQMKPSDYIRRNCYFVAEPEERTIDAMCDLVGEDHILWGSDYP